MCELATIRGQIDDFALKQHLITAAHSFKAQNSKLVYYRSTYCYMYMKLLVFNNGFVNPTIERKSYNESKTLLNVFIVYSVAPYGLF
jgi:hypothetical protein